MCEPDIDTVRGNVRVRVTSLVAVLDTDAEWDTRIVADTDVEREGVAGLVAVSEKENEVVNVGDADIDVV